MSKNGVLFVLFLILAVNFLAIFFIVVDKRGDDNGEKIEIVEEDNEQKEDTADDEKSGTEAEKDPSASSGQDGEIDEGLFIDKVKAQDQGQSGKGKWVATNYAPGDITVNSWTVRSGDTLWEISEARYGSGVKWTSILNQNRSVIGRLPNGQQALIFPGQVLNLK